MEVGARGWCSKEDKTANWEIRCSISGSRRRNEVQAAILDVLAEDQVPLSVAELMDRLGDRGLGSFSRDDVGPTMHLLLKRQLVRKVSGWPMRWTLS